jgi:hypothetical protein
MIAVEIFGTSVLGEVWYAEADTPRGPWSYAVKVVTHEKYSFYNPKQHPLFDQEGGRLIYFEGTYTHTFSGNDEPTPRYDYNQIMYRLDLGRPAVVLPVPVGDVSEGRHNSFATARIPADFARWSSIPFFACDRPGKGTVPVVVTTDAAGRTRLQVDGGGMPVFHAIPADPAERPKSVVPLYEFVNEQSGERAYSTLRAWRREGFERQSEPLCYVWPNPWRPVDD